MRGESSGRGGSDAHQGAPGLGGGDVGDLAVAAHQCLPLLLVALPLAFAGLLIAAAKEEGIL